jgi:hypothetical protein
VESRDDYNIQHNEWDLKYERTCKDPFGEAGVEFLIQELKLNVGTEDGSRTCRDFLSLHKNL